MMSGEALRWVRGIHPSPAPRCSASLQKSVLVALAVNADPSGVVRLVYRSELSDLVESSESAISRALCQLTRSGLISRSRGVVVLPLERGQRPHQSGQRPQQNGQRPQEGDDRRGQRPQQNGQRPLENGQRPHLLKEKKLHLIHQVKESAGARASASGFLERLERADSTFCREPWPVGSTLIGGALLELQQTHTDAEISLAVGQVISEAKAAHDSGRPWNRIHPGNIRNKLKRGPTRSESTQRPAEVQTESDEERMRRVIEEYRSGVRWESNR